MIINLQDRYATAEILIQKVTTVRIPIQKYIHAHLHLWTIYNLAIKFTVPSIVKMTMTQFLGNNRTLI